MGQILVPFLSEHLRCSLPRKKTNKQTKNTKAKSALSFHIEEMGLVANTFSHHYIIKITFQFLTSRVIGLFRDLHCGSSHKPIKCNNKSMILRRLLFSPCRTLDSRIKTFCDKISLGMVGAWVVERNHSIHSSLIIQNLGAVPEM